jgi:hypothetical protein
MERIKAKGDRKMVYQGKTTFIVTNRKDFRQDCGADNLCLSDAE